MSGMREQLQKAVQLFHAGQFTKVIPICLEALSQDADNALATQLAANSYSALQQHKEALPLGERLVKLRPDNADVHYNLGMYYMHVQRGKDALGAFQQAVRIDPKHAKATANAAHLFCKAGLYEEGFKAFNRARALAPTDVAIVNNFANALKDVGSLKEAVKLYEEVLTFQPNLPGVMSNLCYARQFEPNVSLDRLKEVHDEWDQRFGQRKWPTHDNDRDPERPIRVGLVSEDFRLHTVGNYLVGVVESLPEDIEVFCYYLDTRDDDVTERFRQRADKFTPCVGVSDRDFADIVRADKIDVLFDLSGHTSGSRLPLFARKPAPIQMTWLGYVGTTGLKAMDYMIASHASAPVGTEIYYSEDILRFPAPYPHQCYQPPWGDIEIGPLPSLNSEYITFGTFSGPAKLNADVLSTWARILEKVEDSKLLLKGNAYNQEFTRDRIRRMFAAVELDDRLIFESWSEPGDALKTYNKIDVVLDPWPFSGCTTTCEALYMGCPIVTLPGETEASRHTVSFLSGVGMLDGIAMNTAQYIDLAVELAYDIDRREELRETLRERFLASPVCDTKAYGRMLADMIRSAWRKWCEQDA